VASARPSRSAFSMLVPGLTNVQKARIIRAYKPRLDALRRGMDVKVQLGAVWHFSLAVRDPEKSAQFWTKNFDLHEMFRSDEAIALTNDAIIIGFFKGTPHPDTIDHMSFTSTVCARYTKRSRC